MNKYVNVTGCLVIIAIINIFDLVFTIQQVHNTEFIELNPIASFLLLSGNPYSLIPYKLLTLFLCIYILFNVRHTKTGSFAIVMATVLMLFLLSYWVLYFYTLI